MLTHIIVLTNTFPYKGEQFLRTEMELVDSEIPISLWTFLPPEHKCEPLLHRESIEMHVFGENKVVPFCKVKASVLSISALFRNNEVVAAFSKKGRVRNLIKAVKFGYISELRVIQMSDWIRRTYGSNPNLILYSYWMYEVAYVSARLKQIFPKCKFVTRCHRFDLYESQHVNGYLPYRHFILDSADVIFPISDDAKKYLNTLYHNKYDNKMEVARIGSIRDYDIIKVPTNEKLTVVSCSNLIPVKRVQLIAEALKNTDLNIEWYHFGDGETRTEVEAIIERLPENVDAHLMGFTPNKEIQQFYSTHDITALINVSSSEGVPVSIMEAQSYGIPVIATDVGGTSEIVKNRENGMLLDVDFTSQDLLTALDEVIENKESFRRSAFNTWSGMSDQKKLIKDFYIRLSELEED